MVEEQVEKGAGETYKTEAIELTVTREPGCLVRFSIIVPKPVVESGYKQAMKQINKQISIPGFRKGRAPTSMIEKTYAKQIKDEWQDLVLNQAFREALKLSKTTPFSRNSIKPPKIETFNRGEAAEFKLSFEASPTLPTIDPSVLQVEKEEVQPVSEKELEKAFDRLHHDHAEWEEITDRAVEEGDYVEVTINRLDDPKETLTRNTRMHVKEGVMPSWLRTLVSGKNPGDKVEGTSEKDDTLEQEETDFQPTHCEIVIEKNWKAVLPPLDEEFAKKFGAQNMDELREKLQESLETNAKAATHQTTLRKIEDALLEAYPFDLPQTLVERDKMQRIAAQNNRLEQQKISKEAIQGMQEEINQQARKRAEEELRLAFLFRNIAEQNGFSISKDELMMELNQQLWMTSPEEKIIDGSMEPDEIRSRLEVIILNRKAKEHLYDQLFESSDKS